MVKMISIDPDARQAIFNQTMRLVRRNPNASDNEIKRLSLIEHGMAVHSKIISLCRFIFDKQNALPRFGNQK